MSNTVATYIVTSVIDSSTRVGKITEPYLITFESSKMDINLDDISL